MAIAVKSVDIEEQADNVVHVTLSGKLDKEDYEKFAPQIDQLIKKKGKVRMLVEMKDFHGWTLGGVWEDTKFDVRHFNDLERLALVGERRWEKAMAYFCKPFTMAKVRYFETDELEEAQRWIHESA